MKKTFKYILILSLAVFLLFAVCGCSGNEKTKDDILSDISAKGFENEITNTFSALSELTGNSDYSTSIEIISTEETEQENIYECNIICSNSDYEISYDLNVSYTKDKELTYSDYAILNSASLMKKTLPKNQIIEDINKYFESLNQQVEIDEKSLEQEVSETEIGCNVEVPATVTDGILSKDCTITVQYIFSGKWNTYVEYTADEFKWDVAKISEKTWTDTSETGKGDFITIKEVNTENNTLSMSYKKGDKEIKEASLFPYSFDDKTLKIKTDDFTVEIYPDTSLMMSGNKIMPQ